MENPGSPTTGLQDIAALVEDLDSADIDRILRTTVRFMRGKPRDPARRSRRPWNASFWKTVFRIRANAAQALQNWGAPETLPALEEAAQKDPDAAVRSLAKTAIEAIKLRQ
jgi:HEAT repeat protein